MRMLHRPPWPPRRANSPEGHASRSSKWNGDRLGVAERHGTVDRLAGRRTLSLARIARFVAENTHFELVVAVGNANVRRERTGGLTWLESPRSRPQRLELTGAALRPLD